MKYKNQDIEDDEIRVIGGETGGHSNRKALCIVLVVLGVIVAGVLLWWTIKGFTPEPFPPEEDPPEQGYYDPIPETVEQPEIKTPLSQIVEADHAFVELIDTTINDIPLKINIPHKMRFTLYVGAINREDPTILFATQAADVRADNGGIVGAFVKEGEPLAWGGSKRGYCAIINDTVSIGVADNTPLFEEATEKMGYFFRQFPLVDNGQLVENEPKGKSIRRAICDRGGEIIIVSSESEESFHDFAQALVDLGMDQAIYLVGSNSYGWATDINGQRQAFGNPTPPKKKWKNISYLMMRAME
jgi:hypothetical protein